jgi:CubicO group peptidase (beta-lactamase class C family)
VEGFDEDRLERLSEHLAGAYVEAGLIAGCEALVSRRGRVVYRRPLGFADLERRRPVAADTIWRVCS